MPNYEASMSKAYGTELGQRIARFGINLLRDEFQALTIDGAQLQSVDVELG